MEVSKKGKLNAFPTQFSPQNQKTAGSHLLLAASCQKAQKQGCLQRRSESRKGQGVNVWGSNKALQRLLSSTSVKEATEVLTRKDIAKCFLQGKSS